MWKWINRVEKKMCVNVNESWKKWQVQIHELCQKWKVKITESCKNHIGKQTNYVYKKKKNMNTTSCVKITCEIQGSCKKKISCGKQNPCSTCKKSAWKNVCTKKKKIMQFILIWNRCDFSFKAKAKSKIKTYVWLFAFTFCGPACLVSVYCVYSCSSHAQPSQDLWLYGQWRSEISPCCRKFAWPADPALTACLLTLLPQCLI